MWRGARDAIALERRGIPTALFCPDAFRGIVETEARRSGLPSFKPVTVPGHIVALSPEQATANIDMVAKELVHWLTKGSVA